MPNGRKRREQKCLDIFGEACRNRRVELGLTQQEVADAADLHRTYVTDIENGLRNLSFLTLLRVAHALQCPLSQLLADSEGL